MAPLGYLRVMARSVPKAGSCFLAFRLEIPSSHGAPLASWIYAIGDPSVPVAVKTTVPPPAASPPLGRPNGLMENMFGGMGYS